MLTLSFVARMRRFSVALLALLTLGASFPSHALIEFFTAPEFRWTNANGPNVPGGYGSPGAAFDAFKAVNDVPCQIKHVNLHHGASVTSNPAGPGVFWNSEYSYWIWDIEHYDPQTCQKISTQVDGGGWINFFTLCPVEMGGAASTKLLSQGRYEAFCRGVRLDECKDNDCPTKKGTEKGNPVNALTGHKSQFETDYAGAAGMSFRRRYTSQDGGFHSQLSSRLGGSTIPVNAAQACYESVVTTAGVTLPYCGRFLDTSAFQIAFVNSKGRYVIFKGSESAPTTTANIDDKLTALTNGSGQREWRVERDDNTVELFNASGRLISRSFHDGRVHTFTYSDATTPTSVAPGPGYMLAQQDNYGRTLSWTYNSAGQVATMRDPANQVITYTYFDPATCTGLTCKKLQSVTFQDNTQRIYHWNEGGAVGDQATNKRLTGITDELGNRFSTYAYDTSGKVTSSEHAGGVYKYTFSYLPLKVTDPLGTQTSFSYQNYNDTYLPTSIVRPSATGSGNSTETASYDPQGRRYSHVEHGGSRTCFGYDKPRNLEVVRFEGANAGANCTENLHQTPLTGTGFDSYKRRVSTEWHADWRLPKRIAEPLKITTFTYNGEGGVYCESTQAQVNGKPLALVCSKTVQATTDATGGSAFAATANGAARVWTYTYDALGKVLTVDGPRTDVNDVTTYVYYANDVGQGLNRGMLNTITNSVGHVTTFSNYDAHGNAQTIVDANGITTTLTYDLRQRLKTRTTAGELTTYDYDAAGQLKKVTTPDGSFVEYFYDNAHRLYRIQDGLGNKIEYVLDNMGNRKEEQSYDPTSVLSRLMKREINALNWLFKDIGGTSPANQVTEYGYDNAGNVKTVKDALNRTTTSFYDEINRLTKVEDPVNGTGNPTKYEYDGQNHLTKVTDPKNLNTTYTYNGHGDLLTQVSPDTGTTTFTYDAAGNTLTKLDARGVTVTYTYDALNRVLTVTNPAVGSDPLEVVTYTYDTCTNGKGRLCSVADKTGTTTFTYNSKSRLASKTQVVGGLTHTISYNYNAAGQLAQVVTPAGNVIDYTYQNNRPVSVVVNGQTILTEVVYEPFGPNGGWKWGNHTTGTPNQHFRTMDLDYRTTQVQSDQPQVASAPVLKSVIGWDYVNRISGITDPNSTAASYTYGYDNLDRVTSVTPGSGTQTFGFSFDGVGNRLTSTSSGNTTNYNYTSPFVNHRLQSLSGAQAKSYTYDAAGNMLSDGTSTWSYGGNNRPYQVQVGAATIPFAINAFGQRVKKGTGTGTGATRFFYDEAGHLIGEYGDDGALIQETVWLNDLPVAVISVTNAVPANYTVVYYIHTDHLGTPRAITQPSDNKIVWRWDNAEPFGNSQPNENPSGLGTFEYNLRFPGQIRDKETGTYYNYFRDYDPLTGRYIESDPIGLLGGLNTYLYAEGDALAYLDPFGLSGNSADRRKERRKKEREKPPGLGDPNPDNSEAWKRFATFFSPFDYDQICVKWECKRSPNTCSPEDMSYGPNDFIPPVVPKVKEITQPGCRCVESKWPKREIETQQFDWDDWAELAAKWKKRHVARK